MKYPFSNEELKETIYQHRERLPLDMKWDGTLVSNIKAAIWLLRQPPTFLCNADKESRG